MRGPFHDGVSHDGVSEAQRNPPSLSVPQGCTARKTWSVEFLDSSPTAALAAELHRCCVGLRQLPLHRVDGPVTDAAHAVSQALADALAELDGTRARPVPRLATSAAADQLAVVGHELLAGLGRRWDAERESVARQQLVELRRRLSSA